MEDIDESKLVQSEESKHTNQENEENDTSEVGDITSPGWSKPAPVISIEFKKPPSLANKTKANDLIKTTKTEDDEGRKSVDATEVKHSMISSKSPAEIVKEKEIPVPYKEPAWSGVPTVPYSFEVLKSGQILEQIDLSSKGFHVFGRLVNCDLVLAHPTISRFHAVVQYCSPGHDKQAAGYYLYDLGSTHGTFLNKNRIKPNMYVRIQVGHIIKLGLSSRNYILQGPSEDVEPESNLTVTQLKQQRLKEKEEAALIEKKRIAMEEVEEAARKKQEEEEGISWGMGEDADQETDLTENPFAATQNEDLYINDPKKSLRGWFEREGYDLEYDVEEKGYGQFICRVQLPIDNSKGQPITAEAVVRGKKKEAVVQCALEACRILDQHGLLRQANHESKKRKLKNWEEDDFYDSDEDTFLDRTGTVERKRQTRMEQAGVREGDQVHTYPNLLSQHKKICHDIEVIEKELNKPEDDAARQGEQSKQKGEAGEEDELDVYMSSLSAATKASQKKHIAQLKTELAGLRKEEESVRRLANIARPATEPEIKRPEERKDAKLELDTKAAQIKKQLPLFGKRKFGLKKLVVKRTEAQKPLKAATEEYETDSE